MALVHDNKTASLNIFGRLVGFVHAINESMRKSMQFRRTMRELQALSARELADLGIHRSNIASIAYESVYGK